MIKPSNLSLLPNGKDEFRTQKYWDRFFTTRSEAFEWYITFDDIVDVVKSHFRPTSAIVVVGCGNSDLSARAYDAGFHNITNVDYSSVVIEEMQKRNKQRKEMRWLEMNMLDMKAFTDGTFDVAIDKGALVRRFVSLYFSSLKDALYSGDTPQVRSDAMRMSVELARVLKPAGGKYMCISLLEDHILAHLLRTFRALPGWQLDMYKVDSPRKESNQLPFVLVFTRTPGTQGLSVTLHFDGTVLGYSFAAPAEQRAKHVADTEAVITQQVKAARWQYLLRLQLQKLHDGAHQVMELWDKDPAKTTPRFTLAIVDNTRLLSHKVAGQCGVFITPQGEWLFATEAGHHQLCSDLGYKRLIIVSLGRGHSFENLQALQNELSGHVFPLTPLTVRNGNERIPYLTIGDDLGERKVLYQGTSALSGPMTVEDVRVAKDWVRRLVFQQNKGLVQSECPLLAPTKDGAAREPNHASLSSEYHAAIIASFAFLGVAPSGWKDVEFIIIGLGGASLPVFLHRAFPDASLTVVEIDQAVVEVAEKYFGLVKDVKLQVVVADGLAYVAQLPATNRKRAIVIDADSKDLSAGLSCPPAAFLEEAFLRSAAEKVGKSGVLVFNIVCRAQDRFAAAVKSVESIFPASYSVKMQEDVNCVHIAMQQKPENVERFEASACKEKWAEGLGLDELCRKAAGLTIQDAEPAEEKEAPAPAAATTGASGRGGRGRKKRR